MAIAKTDWGDGFKATGAENSDVVGPYKLQGGKYAVVGFSSGTWSVQLAVLSPDGTNYMNCTAAATTAYLTIDLPPGMYKITCGASMTTGCVAVIPIPIKTY